MCLSDMELMEIVSLKGQFIKLPKVILKKIELNQKIRQFFRSSQHLFLFFTKIVQSLFCIIFFYWKTVPIGI